VEGGSCNDYDYVCGDPVNGSDPGGTFAYTSNFDLGESSRSASEYMAMVAANFGQVFPINGRPSTLPDEGSNLNLNVGPAPFPVYVSSRSQVGWTFGTRLGHPDYPGWISFRFSKTDDGHMHLTVHGYVPDYAIGACKLSPACFLFRKRLYRAISSWAWTPFADNLRARGW
jgi:hypothetical protein